MKKELRLVVSRATGVETTIPYLRFEWWRIPELQRLGRLHVVVTVRQNRRRVFASSSPLTQHDGMTGCLENLGLESSFNQFGL